VLCRALKATNNTFGGCFFLAKINILDSKSPRMAVHKAHTPHRKRRKVKALEKPKQSTTQIRYYKA
jgi:hypothetical protein